MASRTRTPLIDTFLAVENTDAVRAGKILGGANVIIPIPRQNINNAPPRDSTILGIFHHDRSLQNGPAGKIQRLAGGYIKRGRIVHFAAD